MTDSLGTVGDFSPPEYKYAGFFRRTGATFIDAIVLFCLMVPWTAWYPLSKVTFLTFMFFAHVTRLVYDIYFHSQFGQTIGKMVMKIELKTVDFQPVDLQRALWRSSVDVFLAIGTYVGLCFATIYADLSVVQNGGWFPFQVIFDAQFIPEKLAFQKQFQSYDPTSGLFVTLSVLWVYAELVTLLFNKKSRAIHDFIAGTVVVQSLTMERKSYQLKHFYLVIIPLVILYAGAKLSSPKYNYISLPESQRAAHFEKLFSQENLNQMLCSPDFDQCPALANDLTIEEDLQATKARIFTSQGLKYIDPSVNEMTLEQKQLVLRLRNNLKTPFEYFSGYMKRRFDLDMSQMLNKMSSAVFNQNAFDSMSELLDRPEHIDFFTKNRGVWTGIYFSPLPDSMFQLARTSKDKTDFICINKEIGFSNEVKINWDRFFQNVENDCKVSNKR